MRRRPSSSIVANPVLVGAVTVLVTTVAVFLAYNANNGLPFVPTTQLRFQVSNGANLLPGNEVREGGYRIGIVESMDPMRLPDGTTGAEVSLKLDEQAGKIPIDTTLDLRPRSVLGLKYVELTRGRSSRTFQEGDLMPARQVTYPVDLEDLHLMFDEDTREAIQRNLTGYGNMFARRGVSLNETIEGLPRFLRYLEPVAENLASPDTQLGRFFDELGDAARVVAPIADRYAHSFSAGGDTFEAWSRHPDRLRQTIENAAPTMRVGIRSFRVQRPFLADFERFSVALRDASAEFPRTFPRITDALQVGTPVVRRSAKVNDELREMLGALRELMADDRTLRALRGLTRTVDIVQPLIRFIGPYVTVCNYFNSTWTNIGEHLTEPDPTGGSQRTLLNQTPRNRNPSDPSIGSIGARRPSNGEPTISGEPVHLHSNLYGAAITHDGKADCEPGQRGYLTKRTQYNDNVNLKIVTDPRTPGVQGPTFTGKPQVPQGQTFSRNPEMGPKFPEELDVP